MEHLTTSQLLQIGGRAGRYGMDFDSGEVTTYKQSDIELLHKLRGQQTEPIKVCTYFCSQFLRTFCLWSLSKFLINKDIFSVSMSTTHHQLLAHLS